MASFVSKRYLLLSASQLSSVGFWDTVRKTVKDAVPWTPVYQVEEPPAKKSRTSKKKRPALASDSEDDDVMCDSAVPGGDGGFVDREAVMKQELVLFGDVKFTRAESKAPHDKFNAMMKSGLCEGFPNLTKVARKALVRPGSNADSEKGFNIPT